MNTTLYHLTRKHDPLLNFRFQIQIGSLVLAGFSEVSGLSVELETENYEEGGVNDYIHKLPKKTKYQPIVLKQGITYSDTLWKWHDDAVQGKVKTMDGYIFLLDNIGVPMWMWNFKEAFPTKWTATDFKASSPEVFIETLELVHKGITKQKVAAGHVLHAAMNIL